MAVQSYMVGVTFMAGIVAGLFVSYLASNFYMDRAIMTVSPVVASDVRQSDTVATTDSPQPDHGELFRPPQSHAEVDKVPVPDEVLNFEDELHHHDDNGVADKLFQDTRVLCWIMTSPETLDSKAKHVKATWGKRCNKLLFVSDKKDDKFEGTIDIKIEHGRDHLTAKTMAAFDYVNEHHRDEADWFMKADDDTYVIMENLRYLLADYKPTEPIYFGHAFKVIVSQGYTSGGGGYAISREALLRFGNRTKKQCAADHGAEDVEWGRCMETLGVALGDSRDALGRSRFHCFDAATFIHGGYPDWYLQYDKFGAQKGLHTISDYAISFHYITVENMYNLEFFIYHIHPYGVVTGLQDLNPRRNGTQIVLTGTPAPNPKAR